MHKSHYSEEKIINMLKEADKRVVDVCRDYGISDTIFYKWPYKYGGMD